MTVATPKINWLLFSFVGIVVLIFGVAIGLMIGKYIYTKPTPTPIISASPTSTPIADPTANWKTYTNTKFGYSIKYPLILTPLETTADIYLHQIAFESPEKAYLSGVIVEVRNLTNLADEVSYRTWRIVGHIADKLDSEIPISIFGLSGKRLNYTSGQKQFSTIIIPYQKLVYSIEAESNLLDQILSTFKFVDQNQTYTCPQTAWVNCMPGPNAPQNPQCSTDYYSWAKKNCPNFQGLAR